MGGVRGDCPIILPIDRTFGGIDKCNGRILLMSQFSLSCPYDPQIYIASDQFGFGTVTVEYFDVQHQLLELILRLIKLLLVGRVDIISKGCQCNANDGT